MPSKKVLIMIVAIIPTLLLILQGGREDATILKEDRRIKDRSMDSIYPARKNSK